MELSVKLAPFQTVKNTKSYPQDWIRGLRSISEHLAVLVIILHFFTLLV